MHCFMPSKELRAYHWAFNSAFPFLLSHQSLSYNQAISTDSEMVMYKPLQTLMEKSSGSIFEVFTYIHSGQCYPRYFKGLSVRMA